MRKATKRYKILDLYKEDPKITVEQLCLLTNSSEHYVKTVISDYHTQNVEYYDICLASGLADDNTFYIFSSSGKEKKIKIKEGLVFSEENLTELEWFYLKINMGITESVKFS